MDTELQKNILKTGAKLFLKYGLRSVSIEDICSELRISKKTFYLYYSQKEELVEAVLHDLQPKKNKRMDPRRMTCQPKGNVIDGIMAFSSIHIQQKNNQFVNFFYDLVKYYPDIHKRQIQRNHTEVSQQIRKTIQDGMEEGLFRQDIDIDLMTGFISVQFMSVMNLTPKDATKIKQQQTFEFVIDVFVRLLCNDAGLAYYLKKRAELPNDSSSFDTPPLRDEDIDSIIDQLMDKTDEITKTVKLI